MSHELVRELRIVRLGQGVDRTGRIAEASLQRVFRAVEEYMEIVLEHDVREIRFCATSAARDAENAEEFSQGPQRVGVAARGARRPRGGAGQLRRRDPGPAAAPEPLLVIDIGGGSTELILGQVTAPSSRRDSLDIGSVRLNERHLAGDPPSDEQVAAAVADIDAALDECSVNPADAGAVIGVAGTVTTWPPAYSTWPATTDPDPPQRAAARCRAGLVTRLLTMSSSSARRCPTCTRAGPT